MKTTKLQLLAIALATPLLTQCLVVEGHGNAVTRSSNNPSATQLPGSAPAGFSQPLTAVTSLGSVTIREGSRTLSSFHTARPNVEETAWHQKQEQIVVKSRGNHGPATVELFDSRSGRKLGTVMAYEIANGGPAWASDMAE
jgi:hypothetical protein